MRKIDIQSWKQLDAQIIHCDRCPRLRKHCLKVASEKRKSYSSETYWGKPVPGFGDHNARLILIGLAPAAHGANRTGRMFTGDRSGDWLYRALHKAGFANQPSSTHAGDGLALHDVYITATARCAPPGNKPTLVEIAHCQSYLDWEISALKTAKIYLGLGKIGFDNAWNILKRHALAEGPRPAFEHGKAVPIKNNLWLLGSYHPSQQNTFTGKLTEPMFDAVFARAKKILG